MWGKLRRTRAGLIVVVALIVQGCWLWFVDSDMRSRASRDVAAGVVHMAGAHKLKAGDHLSYLDLRYRSQIAEEYGAYRPSVDVTGVDKKGLYLTVRLTHWLITTEHREGGAW